MIEHVELTELAADRVYEFCFAVLPIRAKGASALPFRRRRSFGRHETDSDPIAAAVLRAARENLRRLTVDRHTGGVRCTSSAVPEPGAPNVFGRIWQRGTSGWTGSWTVHLEDGTHGVSVILRMGLTGNRLTVAIDGQQVDSSSVFAYLGEIRRFTWKGHAFALRVKGFGMSGEFALFVDGNEVAPDTAGSSVAEAAPHAAATGKTPSSPQSPQFVRELNLAEIDEVIGVEDYPLDNAFGDLALTTDRQVSKACTNEFSVETTSQVTGNVSGEVLSVIKAEIAGQLSKQVGSKVGETVTESQTLHLSVGAHASVSYRVVWKRKVRSGERIYRVDTGEITVPYRMTYGLSCEVRSQELKPQG